MAINYPTSLDNFGNPAGTTLLADPSYLHNQQHDDINDATEALEAKVGVGAGTPKLDYALIGTGNGTAIWGTVWNNATLGTPTITGGTITLGTMVSGSISSTVTISGLTRPFVTVGTSQADYITDGTADQVQIQAAIDAVNTAGGGEIFLKAGTYVIDNTPTANTILSLTAQYYGLLLKSNVHLTGAGTSSVLTTGTIPGTVTDQYFTMITTGTAGVTNVSLQNFAITLPAFSVGGTVNFDGAFALAKATNSYFKDLFLTNGGWRIEAVAVSFNATTKELTTDANNIVFDNITHTGGVGSNFLVSVKDVSITNSRFYNWQDDSIIIVSAGQQVIIDNNILDDQFSPGGNASGLIYLNNDHGVTTDFSAMSDIKITNNSLRRISLTPGGAGVQLVDCRNVEIGGNIIDQCLRGITTNGGNGVNNVVIHDNIIQRCTNQGIYFPYSASFSLKNVEIANNIICNNTGNAVEIINGGAGTLLNGLSVVGNMIFDDQGTITQTGGFYMTANASGAVSTNVLYVGNNTYSGTAVDTITQSGGGTTTNLKIKSNSGIADN